MSEPSAMSHEVVRGQCFGYCQVLLLAFLLVIHSSAPTIWAQAGGCAHVAAANDVQDVTGMELYVRACLDEISTSYPTAARVVAAISSDLPVTPETLRLALSAEAGRVCATVRGWMDTLRTGPTTTEWSYTRACIVELEDKRPRLAVRVAERLDLDENPAGDPLARALYGVLAEVEEFDESVDGGLAGPAAAVSIVQRQLAAAGAFNQPIDGVWSPAMAAPLLEFLQQLQQHPVWGAGWNLSADGRYGEELATHLRRRAAEVEVSDGASLVLPDLRAFLDALDFLSEEGVYQPPPLPAQPQGPDVEVPIPGRAGPYSLHSLQAAPNLSNGLSNGADEASTGLALGYSLLNGFLDEWGDELLCQAFSDDFVNCHERARVSMLEGLKTHPLPMLVLNFLGILFSPGGWIALAVARSSGAAGGSAFKLGFFAEAIETTVAALGEVATFGSLLDPAAVLKFGLIACCVTGLVVAAGSSQRK